MENAKKLSNLINYVFNSTVREHLNTKSVAWVLKEVYTFQNMSFIFYP